MALPEFNRRLVEGLETCLASLGRRRVRSRRSDDEKHLGNLQQALAYVSLQQRVLAGDLVRASSVERLNPHRPGRRMLEAELVRARRRGSRHGLCWDVDSPGIGEGIAGVKYRW
jgi:hypothetical protein